MQSIRNKNKQSPGSLGMYTLVWEVDRKTGRKPTNQHLRSDSSYNHPARIEIDLWEREYCLR